MKFTVLYNLAVMGAATIMTFASCASEPHISRPVKNGIRYELLNGKYNILAAENVLGGNMLAIDVDGDGVFTNDVDKICALHDENDQGEEYLFRNNADFVARKTIRLEASIRDGNVISPDEFESYAQKDVLPWGKVVRIENQDGSADYRMIGFDGCNSFQRASAQLIDKAKTGATAVFVRGKIQNIK